MTALSPAAACPPAEGFRSLLDGYLDESQNAALSLHIEGCGDCQRLLEMLTSDGRIGRRADAAPAVQYVPGEEFLRDLRLAPPPAETESPPLPKIPGYRTLRWLGTGGMGVVYLARQEGLNRLVALKLVRAAASEDVQRRFRREAEAVARLRHERIVQIYEIGEHEGSPFLVLEYIDGVGLDRWSAERGPDAAEAARIVGEIAGAIHAAHRAGIIHRDLKPANILMSGEGVPHVADFGLAKLVEGNDAATRSGQLLGTPGYAAPEQIAGLSRVGAITPATDVYALGAILYELLAGRPPFRADHPVDTLLQVLHTDPAPPSKLRPGVPRDLETICLACLNKSPAKRYASAEALAEDLRRFLAGRPVKARPLGPAGIALRWIRRHPTAGVLAAALILGVCITTAGLAWLWREAEARATLEANAGLAARHRAADLAIDRALTQCEQGNIAEGLRGLEAVAAELPAGETDLEGATRANLAAWGRFATPKVHSWPHPAPIRQALFSPGGVQVASLDRSGTVRLWNVGTGLADAPEIAGNGDTRYLLYRPDGGAVLTATRKGLIRQWDSRTGMAIGAAIQAEDGLAALAYTPDGRYVWTGGKKGSLRRWNAETGIADLTPENIGTINALGISADGAKLLTGNEDGRVNLWDAVEGTAVGAAVAKHRSPIRVIAFPATGPGFAAGSLTELSASLNPLAKGAKPRFFNTPSAVTALAYDSTGDFLAVGGGNSELRLGIAIEDLSHRDIVVRSFPFESEIRHIAVTPGGRRMLGAGDHWRACLWLEPFETTLALRLEHADPVTAAAFGQNGRLILTASSPSGEDRGEVCIWKAPEEVEVPAPSDDGPAPIADAGEWVLREGRLFRDKGTEPIVLPAPARQLFADRGAALLAIACEDRGVYIWDTAQGRLRGSPLLLPELVKQLAWHPGGRILATLTLNGRVRLWDAYTGKPVGPTLLWKAKEIRFTPGGKSLALAGDAGTRYWSVP